MKALWIAGFILAFALPLAVHADQTRQPVAEWCGFDGMLCVPPPQCLAEPQHCGMTQRTACRDWRWSHGGNAGRKTFPNLPIQCTRRPHD